MYNSLLKKIIATMLAGLILFGAAPAAGLVGIEIPAFDFASIKANAASITSEDGMYEYDGNTITKVLKPNELPEDYVIPSIIDDTPITAVGMNAFENCNSIKKLTVPDSINSLSERAFKKCSGISEVYFNASNCQMPVNGSAFASDTQSDNNYSIKTIVFGNNVYNIPNDVCRGMNSLSVVTFGAGVKSIGVAAFKNCKSLEKISIPEKVSVINNHTFEGCSELQEINLNNITNIGEQAFNGCSKLNPVFSEKLATIGSLSFCDCDAIEEVTIPENVTSVGLWAFKGCSNITKIYFNATECSIAVNGGIFSEAGSAVKTVEFGNNVNKIPANVCSHMSSLQEVYFKSATLSIGEAAFYKCPSSFDIYYTGTVQQWENVVIGRNNSNINEAKTYDTNGEYIWVHCEGADEPINYTLTYDANGGINAPVALTSSGNISLSNDKPTREGYTFLGWADNDSATAAQYQPGSSFNLTGDKTIYAIWTEIIYTNDNGGVLTADNSYKTPEKKTVNKVIDVRCDNSSVNFNLRSLTPQQNTNFDGINFGCQCKFDLTLTDGELISAENPTVIRFKKDFIGYDRDSIVIFHYPSSGNRESFTAKKTDPKFRIYDDGDYWKITVTSLSPFGVYSVPTVTIKSNPGTKTIDYGQVLRLEADIPDGYDVHWFIGNRDTGKTGTIFEYDSKNGDGEVKAVLYKDGKQVKTDDGDVIDTETVKVNVGFFKRLIAFFKYTLFKSNNIVKN